MSTLKSRFKYYGLGFCLGLVVVWATLLKDRDRDAWLPEGRTIDFLARTDIKINEHAQCQIDCLKLSSDFMDDAFWEKANINFKESDTQRKPCPEYYITSTVNQQKIIIRVETCEVCENCDKGTATLNSIEISGALSSCDCP